MANLSKYPLEDGFKTSLSQDWDGNTGTVYVANTPNFTFPSGVTTYIVVDPRNSNRQIAEINAYDSSAGTVTVSNITLEKGAGINSTAVTHSVGAEVIISDNFQFWEDITTAVNSKLDNDQDMAWDSDTDYAGVVGKSLTTAQRTALTPTNGAIVYDTDIGELYQYIGGAWSAVSAGSTQPNASTTVAGKVEIATQAELEAGTDTGGTGASTVGVPSNIALAVQKNGWVYGVDGGSANTYTLTLAPAISAYVNGMEFLVNITNANTGPSTLNVNGVGAVNIKTRDGIDPVAGDLESGKIYRFIYDGTNFVVDVTDTVKITGTADNTITAGDLVFINEDGEIQKYYGLDYGTDTFATGGVGATEIHYLTSTKIAVIFRETSDDDLHVCIGDISGGSITFGTVQDIDINIDLDFFASCRLSDSTFAVAYDDGTGTHRFVAQVGSVSGTTVTMGTVAQIDTDSVSGVSIARLTDTLFTVGYYNITDTDAVCVAVSVSGTTCTVGTPEILATDGSAENVMIARVADAKFIVGYRRTTNTQIITVEVGSVSGTAITMGSSGTLNLGEAVTPDRFVPDMGNIADDIAIMSYSGTNEHAVYITVSGTTPSIKTGRTITGNVCSIVGTKFLLGFDATGDDAYLYEYDSTGYTFNQLDTFDFTGDDGVLASGTPPVNQFVNFLNATSTMTVSINDVALTKYFAENSETAGELVQISEGINKSQSGLTPGIKYYAGEDGSLTTNGTGTIQSTLQEMGTALSATSIVLNNIN